MKAAIADSPDVFTSGPHHEQSAPIPLGPESDPLAVWRKRWMGIMAAESLVRLSAVLPPTRWK